jgi:anti-anti-sigma regulatory factor
MESADTPVKAVRTGDVTWLLALRGEHDLSTSETIAGALETLPRAAIAVVDLSAVTFIDVSFLHALRACRVYPQRVVLVAPAGGAARRLLSRMGADRDLRIAGSRRAALVLARRRDHWASPLQWDAGMPRPAVEAHMAPPGQRPAAAWMMHVGKPAGPDGRRYG